MLINKLLFLFEADVDSIRRGTREGADGADDLSEAMRRAAEQSERTSSNLAEFAKGALGWLAAAASAGQAMSMAVARAGEIEALDDLSVKMGASITQTDALARSIVGLGGSTDQAQNDLSSLADSMRERNIQPMEGMLKLADQLAGMDYDQATKTLKSYGITESSTMDLLRKGSGEVRRMMLAQEENGAITQEAADKAKAFNQSLNSLKRVSSDAANSFAQFLMPVLTKVIDFLAKAGKWASENKTFVIAFFSGVAGIVATLFLPAMLAAAAATLAATWPFIAIGLAIGAAAAMFALIYDDIMNFIDGNDSLIGQIINDFPIIGAIINAVVETVKMAFAAAGFAADVLLGGFKLMADGIVGVFKWLWDAIQAYIGFITNIVGKVADIVGGITGWFKDKLGIATEEKVTREVEDVYTGGDDSVSPSNRMSGVDFVDDGGSRSSGYSVHNNDNRRSDATYNNDNSRNNNVNNTDNSRSDAAYNNDNSRISSSVKNSETVMENSVSNNDARRINGNTHNDNRNSSTYNNDSSHISSAYNTDNSRNNSSVYNNDSSRIINEIINNTESAKQYTAQAQQQPANAMTSSAINNQRTNNIESNLTIGQITVETQATDAAGVSAGLSDSLSAELEKMQANNATPITR